MLQQEVRERLDRDRQRDGVRESIAPGGQQRERDGFTVKTPGQQQGGVIGFPQKLRFSRLPARPAGADGVQDILRGETERGRGGAVADGDAPDRPPRFQQRRPRGSVDRGVRPRADAGQRIRGIHDCIRFDFCDIISYDLQRQADAPPFLADSIAQFFRARHIETAARDREEVWS